MRVDTLCGLFGYTRQAYYDSRRQSEKVLLNTEIIIDKVLEIRRQLPRVGAKKLYIMLHTDFAHMGIKIGRDAFAELLANHNLLIRRKRSGHRTTDSKHRYYMYPNLIRGFTPVRANQLWVSDITYIRVGYSFVYLYLITDAYSHKIVGWRLERDLRAVNALKALEGALSDLPPELRASLTHHSDRGVQYCCDEYVKLLKDNKIKISMTEKGDPLENAIAERVNGILKTEWIYHTQLESFAQAKRYIAEIIILYNDMRPHQSISFLTPSHVHQHADEHGSDIVVETQRMWKNYYKKREDLVNSQNTTTFESNHLSQIAPP